MTEIYLPTVEMYPTCILRLLMDISHLVVM